MGAIISIRCKTWSASHHLPDAKGNVKDPPRSWPDHILGLPDANGNISYAVSEGNTESEHAVEIGTAIWRRGGFVMSETPARRRAGTTHYEKHAIEGC